jgi:CO/xanthine dehydrogenase Mo-binding subunit/aerobic-type carbon monoxide dehydrogenase small subunit (CoxS/CutS family)
MARKTVVSATINGEQVEFLCEPRQSLLECLRDTLGLTGTKEGCQDGNCGVCTVALDGRLVNACLVLGVEIEGREVTTVEGLAGWQGLHPLQRAFIDEDALQCGYCTPGILIAAKALLDRDPDPSEERIRGWLAGNLCRCTGYDKVVRAVQSASRQLAGESRVVSEGRAEGYAVIGTRPPRYDGSDKVTGRALFGPDISLPGLLHGKVLRSPHAHARIRAIDTCRAKALPGVYAIVTAEDLPPGSQADKPSHERLRDNTLASDKALYVGHAIAAVAASSPHIAEQAVDLIEVDYEVLPPVLDVLEAMRDDAPLLHDSLRTDSLGKEGNTPSNVANHFQNVKGDPAEGFVQADVIVEREFRSTLVHQGYLEPHAATAVWSADGTLTVYSTTQGAFSVRDDVSELLDMPLSKIRAVPTEIGGGFGGKNDAYLAPVAALLSRKAGRPVKMVMAQSEVLKATGPTPGSAIRVKMGATRDGRITAARAELFYEAGAYPSWLAASGAGTMFAPYDIPHGQVDGYNVVVNKPRVATYRAPGATQASFACEQVIDELAEKVGLDPLQFRLVNCSRDGTRRIDGGVLEDIGGYEVLEAARRTPHYNSPLEGANRGRGVAFAYWGNWGAQSSCTMSVNADGTVNMVTGSVDLSGTRTSLAMQAAEVLGLGLDRIKSSVGDTDSVGYAQVSAGSRTTMATGIAVVRAAEDVISQMRARAAMLWGVRAEAISFNEGVFAASGSDRRLTFAELADRVSETGAPITGVGNVDVEEWGGAFAAHIVDLEVDPETGKVTILRYTAVQDVGQAIHPGHVEGQMQGGTTQGIGWALYEGYAYDEDGQLLNPTLLDYKLPTALDVPMIDTVIVEVPYRKHPFGVRGVGEAPIVPPPGAIANAIYRAVGVRMDELPMTPGRILESMGVIHD